MPNASHVISNFARRVSMAARLLLACCATACAFRLSSSLRAKEGHAIASQRAARCVTPSPRRSLIVANAPLEAVPVPAAFLENGTPHLKARGTAVGHAPDFAS
eukprot:6178906-Pleurochrysis_carterae.AAC.1